MRYVLRLSRRFHMRVKGQVHILWREKHSLQHAAAAWLVDQQAPIVPWVSVRVKNILLVDEMTKFSFGLAYTQKLVSWVRFGLEVDVILIH